MALCYPLRIISRNGVGEKVVDLAKAMYNHLCRIWCTKQQEPPIQEIFTLQFAFKVAVGTTKTLVISGLGRTELEYER